MRNRCYCEAQLAASSPGEYAALGHLAEQEGFELPVRFIASSRTASEVWQDCRRPQVGPVRDCATQLAYLTGISVSKNRLKNRFSFVFSNGDFL
jgi:hypothetical protein